jgi:hypothetical protein
LPEIRKKQLPNLQITPFDATIRQYGVTSKESESTFATVSSLAKLDWVRDKPSKPSNALGDYDMLHRRDHITALTVI